MTIKFINEIEKDYSEYCFDKLKRIDPKYRFKSEESCFYDYQRYKFRCIEPTPRKVLMANSFEMPAEFKLALEEIVKDIELGNALRKYQSRNLRFSDYDDFLLMDWGIQHLHLGVDEERNGFVTRTKELLFIKFTFDSAYLIGVFNHGDWAAFEMLEVLQKNWPEVLEPFKAKRAVDVGYIPCEREIIKLRKAGVNTAVQLKDGSVYMCLGGGITAAGTPGQSVHNTQYLRRLFESRFNYIKNNFYEICPELKLDSSTKTITVGLCLSCGRLEYILRELGCKIVFPP